MYGNDPCRTISYDLLHLSPQVKKEVARGEEKSTGLKRDLHDAKDKIVHLENRIHEMVRLH